MNAPLPAAEVTFAARLRESTQAAHTNAENVGFMTDLMSGNGTIADYADLVSQYYYIYDALESVGETYRHDPIGSAFVDDALLRREAIDLDLTHFYGANWRAIITPTDATLAYVDRLQNVATRGSAEYAGHHYIRFLGDLSGGQIIRVMVQRHYGIPAEGLNFLDFPLIPKPKPYKDNYRAALENAAWTPEERDALVAEVSLAYDLNSAVFNALGARRAQTA